VANRFESHLFEDGAEQRSMLEAITASAGANEFLLQAIEIEAYRPTEQNIEVLERNEQHMRAKNTRKRLVLRTRATAPLNPVEIGVEVETVLHVIDHASRRLMDLVKAGEYLNAALEFYRQIRRRSS
jgi:hypothetical protein